MIDPHSTLRREAFHLQLELGVESGMRVEQVTLLPMSAIRQKALPYSRQLVARGRSTAWT